MDGSPEVTKVVGDAARLLGSGELVVFGSSALAFWMQRPPRSKDVDVWCVPKSKGDVITALMGELSWYHEKHGVFVEVWAPETFAAPADWRTRSKRLLLTENPKVSVVLPHPHDVMMAKLERMEVKDREHTCAILAEFPLDEATLAALVQQMPARRGVVAPDRVARFEAGLAELRVLRSRHSS
jgi:hypothetical protein